MTLLRGVVASSEITGLILVGAAVEFYAWPAPCATVAAHGLAAGLLGVAAFGRGIGACLEDAAGARPFWLRDQRPECGQ